MLDRRTLLTVPPALLLAGAGGAAPSAALRWDSHYLFLRVSVNGKPVDALLDFNVRTTLLDRRRAASLGVDGQGAGVVIDAAGVRVGPLKVALLDLADYANQRLHGRIGMVLGRDLFAAAPWLLDPAALSLTTVGRQTVRQGTRLPISDRFGFATVPILVNGSAAQAALMFNDMDMMHVGASFAARIGLARPRGSAAVQGLTMRAAGISVDRLEIAGLRIDDVPAALEAADHAPDAWIGPAILRRFRIGIDLAGDSLWFAPV